MKHHPNRLRIFAILLTLGFLLLHTQCLFAQVPQELVGLWEWKHKKDLTDRIDHFTYQFIAPDSFFYVMYAQGGDVCLVGKVRESGAHYVLEFDSLMYLRDIGVAEWQLFHDQSMMKMKWQLKYRVHPSGKLFLVYLPSENRKETVRWTMRKVDQPSPTWPRQPLSERE